MNYDDILDAARVRLTEIAIERSKLTDEEALLRRLLAQPGAVAPAPAPVLPSLPAVPFIPAAPAFPWWHEPYYVGDPICTCGSTMRCPTHMPPTITITGTTDKIRLTSDHIHVGDINPCAGGTITIGPQPMRDLRYDPQGMGLSGGIFYTSLGAVGSA